MRCLRCIGSEGRVALAEADAAKLRAELDALKAVRESRAGVTHQDADAMRKRAYSEGYADGYSEGAKDHAASILMPEGSKPS